MIKATVKSKFGKSELKIPSPNGEITLPVKIKFGKSVVNIPTSQGEIPVAIRIKFGTSTVDIPITIGDKIYFDNAPQNLSELNSEVFTIINQIPTSADNAAVKEWKMYKLRKCDKKDGLYDKAKNQMYFKENAWTAFLSNWQSYKKPLWTDGGFYSLEDKTDCYTVNIGDLLIFADVSESVPTSRAEFEQLKAKYKNCGGTVTGCEVYVNYKRNGQPWKSNHIEVIKA